MSPRSEDSLGDPARCLRTSYPFWAQDRVRWSDTDMIGHANNLSFAAFCETGRALLLRELLGPDSAYSALLVIAELRLRFIGEMHWPDTIDIGNGVSHLGGSSCVIAHALFSGERCVAVAESTLVLIDPQTRRSRSLPPEIRAWLEARMLLRA